VNNQQADKLHNLLLYFFVKVHIIFLNDIFDNKPSPPQGAGNSARRD